MSPRELPIAQEKNNLSTVLTEMSAGCPGGLEVSNADQSIFTRSQVQNQLSPLTYQSKFFIAKVTIFIYEMYDHN
jgi:hypothetical protein